MKTRILLALIATFAIFTASAQQSKTVNWRLIVKLTSATEGVATLKGTIEPGWHLYGTQAVKNGPKPTVVDFKKSTGIVLTGNIVATPKPVTDFDKLFEQTLSWWEGTVTFRQNFKVTDPAKAKVNCSVSYTTCNNVNCSMPVTESLSKPLPKKISK